MPQSLAQNYIHLIFSTKERAASLSPGVQERLYPYLAKAFEGEKSPALKIGGVGDHVHVLFRLSKNIALATLIGKVKGQSSNWMKEAFPGVPGLSWQNGYGAFSVSASRVDDAIRYISRQAEHHRKRSFKEEFREFLEKYGVEYDERYVWD